MAATLPPAPSATARLVMPGTPGMATANTVSGGVAQEGEG